MKNVESEGDPPRTVKITNVANTAMERGWDRRWWMDLNMTRPGQKEIRP